MSKFNFKRVMVALEPLKKEAAKAMVNASKNYFLASFKNQGYDGKKWKEVNRRIPSMPEYRYPKKKGLSRRTKPILIGTGRLKREVSGLARTARITYSKYDFKAQIRMNESNVPYAGYILRGTKNMVARPYMGNTSELRKILKTTLKNITDKAWA